MKNTIAAIVLSLTAAASAQTVYEPVKYQHGRYGETFYGGANPNALTVPGALYTPATAALSQRFYVTASGRYIRFDTRTPMIPTHIYSDLAPYTEVSQYGYTVADARNEAYLNAPRFQTAGTLSMVPGIQIPHTEIQGGMLAGPIVTQAIEATTTQPPQREQPPAEVAERTSSPSKAVPLINWARNERERNPALYRALLKEARKYDPAAVDRLERE